MTRNTAREIATHLAYELSFTDLPIQEFLDQQLSRENFAARAEECGLYADTPNDKQESPFGVVVNVIKEEPATSSTRRTAMNTEVRSPVSVIVMIPQWNNTAPPLVRNKFIATVNNNKITIGLSPFPINFAGTLET